MGQIQVPYRLVQSILTLLLPWIQSDFSTQGDFRFDFQVAQVGKSINGQACND